MQKKDIYNTILSILEKDFGIKESDSLSNMEVSLLLVPFSLEPMELVQLVVILMKKFSIHFDSADFTNYKFSNINSICNIIYNKIGDEYACN